jgi:hypothetical protein
LEPESTRKKSNSGISLSQIARKVSSPSVKIVTEENEEESAPLLAKVSMRTKRKVKQSAHPQGQIKFNQSQLLGSISDKNQIYLA